MHIHSTQKKFDNSSMLLSIGPHMHVYNPHIFESSLCMVWERERERERERECVFCFSIPVVVSIFSSPAHHRPLLVRYCVCVCVCILFFYPSSSDDICQKDHFYELPTTLP